MDITVNPLHGLVSVKLPDRPKWMCRHAGARIFDAKHRIYECMVCNPTTGTITVIPGVPTTKTSPKKVTVSPTPESPKGV